MKFIKAKDEFLNWLVIFKWKSDKTQEQYSRHLLKFEDFLFFNNGWEYIWNIIWCIDVENITLEND